MFSFFSRKKKSKKKGSLFYTRDILEKMSDIAEVGDFTYGDPKVLHWGEGARLKIGKFCSISANVSIFLGGNHRTDWITTYPFPALVDKWPEAAGIKGHPATKGDVVIGNDVWIARDATILSGVKIGHGAVIGAGAVVGSDVAPYAVVIGNPAREVRKRFDDKTVVALLELKWWDWPVDKIRSNIDLLCSGSVEKIIQQ